MYCMPNYPEPVEFVADLKPWGRKLSLVQQLQIVGLYNDNEMTRTGILVC